MLTHLGDQALKGVVTPRMKFEIIRRSLHRCAIGIDRLD